MARIKGTLITVRTAKQGAAMEKSKFAEEYRREIATLNICPEDLAELGLSNGEPVLLRSAEAEITVVCRGAEGPRGVFFLPLGPTANLLIGRETHGTGVPDYKGIPAELLTPEKEV